MRRPYGVEACEGVVEAEHLDFDADPEGETCQSAAIEAAELLAAHVGVACTQVEAFGDQEFGAENGVAEKLPSTTGNAVSIVSPLRSTCGGASLS